MGDEFDNWARAERQFIRDEIKWLKAGSRVVSPSGEDITGKKLVELEARLEHANKIIAALDVSPPK